MKQELKGKRRQQLGIKSLYNTCKYSLAGIVNYFLHEASGKRYAIVMVIQIALMFIFKVNITEILFILVPMFLILALELVNTAIESVCDLVSPEYNKFVKIAKDSGSGATFVVSTLSFIIHMFIYLPKIF